MSESIELSSCVIQFLKEIAANLLPGGMAGCLEEDVGSVPLSRSFQQSYYRISFKHELRPSCV